MRALLLSPLLLVWPVLLQAQTPTPAAPAPPVAPSAPTATPDPGAAPEPAKSAAAAVATPPLAAAPTRGAELRALHEALAHDRLGSQVSLDGSDLERRLRSAEEASGRGDHHTAVHLLASMVEHPQFSRYEALELGLASRAKLAESYASLGAFEIARAYQRALLATPAAWQGVSTYGRRATQRLVEIALSRSAGGQSARVLAEGLHDLGAIPSTAPADVRAEVDYLRGRHEEARDKPEAALEAYARVPESSRHWSQATYLRGLIEVERGRAKQGEELFCKVADPLRQSKTPPVVSDARYFAVRDLARLALGRVAHEAYRFDDSRYYYYLVPQDSGRLEEALYESATGRYEKRDYQSARDMLAELKTRGRHRYQDEAHILDAYVDIGLCEFDAADEKLKVFLAEYDPLRASLRRAQQSEAHTLALLAGRDLSASDRRLLELLTVDPAFGEISRAHQRLSREEDARRATVAEIDALSAALQSPGQVRPAVAEGALVPTAGAREERLRGELAGVERALADLEATQKKDAESKALRAELELLRTRLSRMREVEASAPVQASSSSSQLATVLVQERARAEALGRELEPLRRELEAAELSLAKDALRRADARLTRLLRRARLARIESVLGKKRALEVEVEAIAEGFLPRDAVDALGPQRYLEEHEEYWPFEGDDWPDEFIGSEGLR